MSHRNFRGNFIFNHAILVVSILLSVSLLSTIVLACKDTCCGLFCVWGSCGTCQSCSFWTGCYNDYCCSGCSECTSGQTQTQTCGTGTCQGTQTRTCSGCKWGSWGACSTDGNSCGNCGYCLSGTCTNQGACSLGPPAQTQTQSCGRCNSGTQTRTCQ